MWEWRSYFKQTTQVVPLPLLPLNAVGIIAFLQKSQCPSVKLSGGARLHPGREPAPGVLRSRDLAEFRGRARRGRRGQG